MTHQRSYRLGWQSQNLARFILYKFSFLAEPVQIADDIGVDFFCTLFETKWNQTNADLIPRNSFAIQIKSESETNPIDLTRYLPYLQSLELPFFFGTVDRTNMALTIFSGEFLTPFFVYKGPPDHLEAELCERSRITDLFDWATETSSGRYVLLFPKITKITASMNGEQLESSVKEIQEICSLMLDNIAASVNKEFILKGAAPYHQLLFAGPESLRFFETNFFERLSEAFYNLNWAYSIEELKPQVEDRFRLYERVYLQLVSYFGEDDLPNLLKQTYKDAKNRMGSS
jgi:hypothetical protein